MSPYVPPCPCSSCNGHSRGTHPYGFCEEHAKRLAKLKAQFSRADRRNMQQAMPSRPLREAA